MKTLNPTDFEVEHHLKLLETEFFQGLPTRMRAFVLRYPPYYLYEVKGFEALGRIVEYHEHIESGAPSHIDVEMQDTFDVLRDVNVDDLTPSILAEEMRLH